MEALELADNMLDGVLELIDKVGKLLNLPKDIRALKLDELAFMKSLLEGIDKTKIQDRIGCFMEQILREVTYEVEDVVAECKHVLERPESSRFKKCSNPFAIVNWKRRSRLNGLKKKVSIARDKVKFSMKAKLSVLSHRQEHSTPNIDHCVEYPTLLNNEDTEGLQNVLEKMKTWILESSSHQLPLKVIGVYGMPGVGKTTLARRIWKDMKEATSGQHFDAVVFVHLSSSFDLKGKVSQMLREVSHDDGVSPKDGDELYELLGKLRKQLEDRKYLIILDDVWQTTERWWDSLKSGLPQNGSCVIVTTRNMEVARSMGAMERYIHHHTTLSEDHSCQLFLKFAFPNKVGAPIDSVVKSYAKKIAAKCEGLPLAIKLVAGTMSGKEPTIPNWRKMFEYFNGELYEKGHELLDSVIRRSYESLPEDLKFFFLCFSIFPEDHEILLEDVVHIWESQCPLDLIHKSEGKTTFEKGEECFNELINRCLLLGRRKDIFETSYQTCEIHGMVRATAIKIAKEKNFMIVSQHKGNPSQCSPRVCVITGSEYHMDHCISNEVSSKWRILLGRDIHENGNFLTFMKSKVLRQSKRLRVIDVSFDALDDLEDHEFSSWLRDIGSFSLLTCLKIHNSRLKALPKSIKKLRNNLHTLCLSECYELKELPPEIGYLKKLTTIDVSSCDSLQCLPIQIERLSNLEILYGFKPSCRSIEGGCHMASLEKFPRLRKLWIQIDSSDQIETGDLVVLSKLKKLEVLVITVEDNGHDLESIIRKLDCRLPSPLEHLHHLYLHNFPGEENPQWLNPVSLPNLNYLHIYGSNIRRFSRDFLGDHEKVWRLESLVLTNLSELEEWQDLVYFMPSLQLLKVDECSKLAGLLPCSVENGLGSWKRIS